MGGILVIGSINMDLVLQTPRIPGPGESFLGSAYSWIPGGKGANQALGAARAGGEVIFLGKVGSDENGAVLKSELKRSNIDTGSLSVSDDSPTGLAVILVEPSGENRIIVYPGANLDLTSGDIDRVLGSAVSPQFDAILLSFEIPVDVIEYAAEAGRNAGIPVYVDAGPAREVDMDALRGVRLLSPNRSELEALSGKPCETLAETRKAAAALFRRTEPEYLAVKMGEEGALLLFGEGPEQLHIPAFTVDAVDGTAAGDAFTAGLTVEHLRTGDIRGALRYASAAGALAASRLGAQPSLPRRAEVEEFLKNRSS